MKITNPDRVVTTALNVNAGGVTYVDTGGFFGGGTLTLAEILALIGAGIMPTGFLRSTLGEVHVLEAHGALGATAVFDLINANVHTGELAEDCDITIVDWTAGKGCYTRLSITGDGSSTPSLPEVTWIGSAPGVIALADVLHMTIFSDDGGTTQWGAVVGGGSSASSDGLVPYLIEAGETFTVPIKKQALFNYPITVDPGGSLVVNGYLLAVS